MKSGQLFFSTLYFIFLSAYALAQPYEPMADPKSMVLSGHARFTMLTDHVIRLEYSGDSTFTDQATLTMVNRKLSTPDYHTSEENGWLIIKTKFSTLHYLKNSGAFKSSNLYIEYHDPLHSFTWKPGMKDKKNLKGTTRTLDGATGKFSFMKLKKIKLEDGILSRSGWTVVDDVDRPLFDRSDWPWVQNRIGGDVQDLYFFGYGSDFKAALFDFTLIAGKISLPPKYAFGIWYSRYWNYTEQDFKDIVAGYRQNNIPLDVLVIDMDWHVTDGSSPEIFDRYTPRPNGWTGFTWERKYFPDYHEFLSWTDAQQLQTCMNLHPAAGVQPHEAAYPAFAAAMGVDTTHHPAIAFDITNKKFAKNYFDILLHPYEKAGVDFWWLDWQQWGQTNIKGVNPTFYLNYVHFSDMQRQGKRPLIFHRWGGLGNHRYEIGFSGDYFINWKSLDYQPEFTANASNVGFGYWSHDIGGHMNPTSKKDKLDPELYTRWVEWGAFSPIFRTHATKDPVIERRMWKYPEENLKAMRKVLQQRCALIPYIYTMGRLAYDSGVSLIRPMYYEFPDMNAAYHMEHQFYFGADMIVAPVTKSMEGKERISQSVWLPAGTWYDYRDGRPTIGERTVTADYALDEVPVYIRAGSIIPTQTAKLRVSGSVLDTLILTIYPDQHASFDLYEDDGTTEGYRENINSYTHFIYQKKGEAATLGITPDGRTFPTQVKERSYEIRIIASAKPHEIKVNGSYVNWSYDDKTQVTTINTAREKLAALTFEIK